MEQMGTIWECTSSSPAPAPPAWAPPPRVVSCRVVREAEPLHVGNITHLQAGVVASFLETKACLFYEQFCVFPTADPISSTDHPGANAAS